MRNYHLAYELARRFSVTIFQLVSPGDTPTSSDTASCFERVISVQREHGYTPGRILKGLIGPLPISVLNYSSQAALTELRTLLSNGATDAVQLESVHLFKYLEVIRSAPNRPAVLVDWHNIESELMRRYAAAAKNPAKAAVAFRTAQLLQNTEDDLLRRADVHTVVSEREREELLKRNPNANVHVIANGVDTSFFCAARTSLKPRTLAFVGSMDYHANIDAVSWFVRDAWPLIGQEFPELQFVIAGRKPTKSVRALASERIHVTGTVDDIRRIYADAFAVIVPLRLGGGTRLKILEAMAAGVPVISTRAGAEGIMATDGVNILLADTAEQMSQALRTLDEDEAGRMRLIEAARKLVVDEYDWRAVGQQLIAIYSDMR